MREPANTNPGIERLFVEVLDAGGIPRPETNVFVEGYNVDAVWREQKVIVELDSRAHHMTTSAFEEDRERDDVLQLAEYRVTRLTWRRLSEHPERVVARLRAHLDLSHIPRGRQASTWTSRGDSCESRSPVGLVKQPGKP